MIGAAQFADLVVALRTAGHADDDIEWAENIEPPPSVDAFVTEIIFVICNSGMKNTVALKIFKRVMDAKTKDKSAGDVFRHQLKCRAIDDIWKNGDRLFREYLCAADKLEFIQSLPHIGAITKYHVAKNFGLQYAKPDVHLQRLADREGCTAQQLCERLSASSGYKIATVDTLLWRACAVGILDSKTGNFADG